MGRNGDWEKIYINPAVMAGFFISENIIDFTG